MISSKPPLVVDNNEPKDEAIIAMHPKVPVDKVVQFLISCGVSDEVEDGILKGTHVGFAARVKTSSSIAKSGTMMLTDTHVVRRLLGHKTAYLKSEHTGKTVVFKPEYKIVYMCRDTDQIGIEVPPGVWAAMGVTAGEVVMTPLKTGIKVFGRLPSGEMSVSFGSMKPGKGYMEILHNASTIQGDSGSPILDYKEKIVGTHKQWMNESCNKGFSTNFMLTDLDEADDTNTSPSENMDKSQWRQMRTEKLEMANPNKGKQDREKDYMSSTEIFEHNLRIAQQSGRKGPRIIFGQDLLETTITNSGGYKVEVKQYRNQVTGLSWADLEEAEEEFNREQEEKLKVELELQQDEAADLIEPAPSEQPKVEDPATESEEVVIPEEDTFTEVYVETPEENINFQTVKEGQALTGSNLPAPQSIENLQQCGLENMNGVPNPENVSEHGESAASEDVSQSNPDKLSRNQRRRHLRKQRLASQNSTITPIHREEEKPS